MGIAIKEIDRLNHLITEFLDYARPTEFEKKPMDLSILLSEVIESVRLDPASQAVVFDLKISPSVLVRGHSDKLKQALLNIIVNALQAMEKSAEKKLLVELTPKKSTALLRICDTGSGISEANLKKIFEPFHTTKTKGTGLGLSIVHSILEAHAVQIEVKSVVDQGTEFCLTFGLAQELVS